MSKTIFLGIYVSLNKKRRMVGEVNVTEQQFKAAMAEWNSPEMVDERARWVKDRGERKVFWDGERVTRRKKSCGLQVGTR